MTLVGQVLTEPETGWKRLDDRELDIPSGQYVSGNGNDYKSTLSRGAYPNNLTFSFFGSKIRIIGNTWNDSIHDPSISCYIDDVLMGRFDSTSSNLFKVIMFDISELSNTTHTVKLVPSSKSVYLDAIDVSAVGASYPTPETGWKRYDNTNPLVKYTGTWTHLNGVTGRHNSTESYSNDANATISFDFVGSKLRILEQVVSNRSTKIEIMIDGILYEYSAYRDSAQFMTLVFEESGLTWGKHSVEIRRNSGASGLIGIDAFDIDATGFIVSPPKTKGQLCTNLQDMEIGDYIRCSYKASSGAIGQFFGLGGDASEEIPVTGTNTPNGSFYFVKADKGLLISDRIVQHSVSWDTLNSITLTEGLKNPFSTANMAGKDIMSNNPNFTNNNPIYSKVKANHIKFRSRTEGVQGTINYDQNSNNAANIRTVWWFNPGIINLQPLTYVIMYFVNNAVHYYIVLSSNDVMIATSDGNVYYDYPPSSYLNKDCYIFASKNGNELIVKLGDNPIIYIPISPQTRSPLGTTIDIFSLSTTSSVDSEVMFNYFYTYNNASLVATKTFDEGVIRSLNGGIVYADNNGNPVMKCPDIDYGCWPTINEYDKYIRTSTLEGKIIPNDEDVWHHKSIYSWCIETPMPGSISSKTGNSLSSLNTQRCARGDLPVGVSSWNSYTVNNSNSVSATYGFRPVLQFEEQ